MENKADTTQFFGNPTGNPWKDYKNRWYTIGLFYELTQEKSRALFTIYEVDREIDGKKYISLGDRYIQMDHIPGYEYEFANIFLGGWTHWQHLQNSSKTMRDLVQGWKDELEIRLKAGAAKSIIQTALSDQGATSFNANKWLSDKGWVPAKGRPKKADIQREAKIAAGVESSIEEDLNRLRLVK